jgi:hypothetical protein
MKLPLVMLLSALAGLLCVSATRRKIHKARFENNKRAERWQLFPGREGEINNQL